MDTKILEYVVAVAENKSLSKTAEQFYLSQPILSRHIKNIEEELGAKLFERAHNQMLLTDAGRIYINSARAILYTEQKLLNDLENLKNETRTVIRVMVDPYLRPLFERAVLPEFRTAFPKCDVQLSDGNEKLAKTFLKNKLVNMAVLKGFPTEKTKESTEVFFQEELVLALPQEWQIQSGTSANDALHMIERNCLLMEQSDPVMRECERRILDKNSLEAKRIIEVEGSANLIRLVSQAKGAAIVPLALAGAYEDRVTVLHFAPQEPFAIYGRFEPDTNLRKEEKGLLDIVRRSYEGMNHYMKKILQH